MLSPTWQFLLATLPPLPDAERLSSLVAVGSHEWDELYALCLRHGLFPLAWTALQTLPPDLVPAVQRERLRTAAAACMLRSLAMDSELRRLQGVFTAAGIRATPFKGPVLAAQAYGDVALRVFDDLDLMVPLDEIRRAVAILEGEGYVLAVERRLLAHRDFFSLAQHVGLYHPSGEWLVEIHWALFNAWRRTPLTLDGDPPTDEELLLYLCLHGTGHWWHKLKWVVDIDRLVRSAPGLDWAQLFARAGCLGCRRAVSLGLLLAQQWCGTPLPGPCRMALADDAALRGLEAWVAGNWQDPENFEQSRWQRYRFTLAARERKRDRLLMAVGNLCLRFRRWRLGMA